MRRTLSVCGNRYVVGNCEGPVYRSRLFEQLREHIYSTTPDASLSIGKRSLGHISNYYTGLVISDEEVSAIQDAAEKFDVNVLNTRYVLHFETRTKPELRKGPERFPNRVHPSGCLFRGSAIC